MKTLLLEIGSEEIPAGYIQPALDALCNNLLKKLADLRITCGAARTYATPRRLAVTLADVAEKQPARTAEVMGPPAKVAYDQQGAPTTAALKFAEKVGVSVNRLATVQTPKGDYLTARKVDRGQATRTLLKEALPDILLSLPFPKTMRWSKGTVAFARPIISVLALFGDQVVPFSVGTVKSGRYTFGHSIMAPGKIKIDTPGAYLPKLEEARVIADHTRRKQLTENAVNQAAASVHGTILADAPLCDTVTHLVEYPVAVAGTFDAAYLELPREILITSMREHQKYFAVTDTHGNLLPNFIAVSNTLARDMDLVRKGHERVLRARLEDARFFFRTDVQDSLDGWNEKLKKVLFQAKLGSMHAKVQRIEVLTAWLADAIGADTATTTAACRAATLCKADLVSQVVGEFPNLQGIMGRHYALAAGESADTAEAIESHYRPTFSGGPLPGNLAGALVAVADKIDSICGCFHVGLIPSGAADPYALRRQSIGIVQILLEHRLDISLSALIEKCLSLFDDRQAVTTTAECRNRVLAFFKSRMSHLLAETGTAKEVIAAVTEISVDNVPHLWKRAAALETLRAQPDFEPLAVAFKRVMNIVRKADPANGIAITPSLFTDPSETALHEAFTRVRQKVSAALADTRFDRALQEIAVLRPDVDAFFDGVLVMAEDPDVRSNRLGLLRAIGDLFSLVADFSKM